MSRLKDAEIAVNVYGWRWVGVSLQRRMLIPPDGDPRHSWTARWDEHGIPHWLPKFSEGETE